MEEHFIKEPTKNNVLYVFSMDKVADFIAALQSVPSEEIGEYQVYSALRRDAIIFKNDKHGIIYKTTPVFCLITDFKTEDAHLRASAERESLFYYPVVDTDKEMINWFFDIPDNRPQAYINYMISINKL